MSVHDVGSEKQREGAAHAQFIFRISHNIFKVNLKVLCLVFSETYFLQQYVKTKHSKMLKYIVTFVLTSTCLRAWHTQMPMQTAEAFYTPQAFGISDFEQRGP